MNRTNNNYEFLSQWVIDHTKSKEQEKILDYGCGAAQTVELLRDQEYLAFGCDIFDEAFVYDIPSQYIDEGIVRKMSDVIPFEDNTFNIVINNMVMEHVDNLDSVLSEINRVLKPGGIVLSIFPHKGIWREGHTGIPFLHWFQKQSSFRIYYCAFLHFLGFGEKSKLSAVEWSKNACKVLDDHTIYRTMSEIRKSWLKQFSKIEHIEKSWFISRYGDKYPLQKILPASLLRPLITKVGALAFVANKSL